MLKQVMDKNEAVKNQLARLKSSSGVCVINSNTSVCHRCFTRAAGAQWPTGLCCPGALERRSFGQSHCWTLGTGMSL